MRYRNRKRVVTVSFAAAHFVGVSVGLVGLQESESATWVTVCHPLYSGCAAPVTRMLSYRPTPALAPVPVVASVVSAFPPTRFITAVMDPLCTVTVSVLRVRLSTFLADGLPPWGAVLPTTDRDTMTAGSADPAPPAPPVGFSDGVPRTPTRTPARTLSRP